MSKTQCRINSSRATVARSAGRIEQRKSFSLWARCSIACAIAAVIVLACVAFRVMAGGGTLDPTLVTSQPAGRTVAAGHAYPKSKSELGNIAQAADGALDPTFGSGGKVTTDFSNGVDQLYRIAVQPNGKIVAIGTTRAPTGTNVYALARYNPNGTLDATFGIGGKVTIPPLPNVASSEPFELYRAKTMSLFLASSG